jgi:hypothetical protein
MAYENKAALMTALELKFGTGNVTVDDAALPDPNGANLPGCTTHRVRYLDESNDSGNMLAATAIRKADGTWLPVNDIAERNNKSNQLLKWIDNNQRPWDMVTEVRQNFDRNSAKIETVTAGVVERYVVGKPKGSNTYTAVKIADGAFL